MTMGQEGMADMGEMGMQNPRNSIPMIGGSGPFDYITMGGMFTIFKVREGISSYDDPGWYQHPAGTVADVATEEALKHDGIEITRDASKSAAARVGSDPWCGVPPANPKLLARSQSISLAK